MEFSSLTIIPYSINRKDVWDAFVGQSKQGTFLLTRKFIDYGNNHLFDCSLMVYQGITPDDDYKETKLGLKDLVAVFPANWEESTKTVFSHQACPYGGLLTHEEISQVEVLRIMQKILMYFHGYLGAECVVYKVVPYIYSRIPSGEDNYALFRAGGAVQERAVSTCVDVRNPLSMRTLRVKQTRRALEHGCYVERVMESDSTGIAEFMALALGIETCIDVAGLRISSASELQNLMIRFVRNIRVLVVRNAEAAMIAGAVMMETERVAQMQFDVANEEARSCGALDLLFRHMCGERYREMEYVDFGFSTERGGRSLNERLINHKEGFGGRTVCYDTYRIPLDRERLSRMIDVENEGREDVSVRLIEVKKLNERYEPDLSQRVLRVINNGLFLRRDESTLFAESFARYCGAEHCVMCQSGMDALKFILRGYRMIHGWTYGDEIMVPALVKYSTLMSIREAGLKPVLVDVERLTCHAESVELEKFITPRTKALICVHSYGHIYRPEKIKELAERHSLMVVEDATDAHGALYSGVKAGAWGDAAAFDFGASSNLGGVGCMGCVTTSDDRLTEFLSNVAGVVSEVDAAVLNVKLPGLDVDNAKRQEVAKMYLEGIENPMVRLPQVFQGLGECSWTIFPVFVTEREALQEFLRTNSVETVVHYAVPAYKRARLEGTLSRVFPVAERIHATELSLPISPVMKKEDVEKVISLINRFVI